MSLLTYNSLIQLVETGVINAPIENVNGGSIDITLGPIIKCENSCIDSPYISPKVDDPFVIMWDLREGNVALLPGQIVLAESQEVFNLPDHIFAEYKLKSSLARIGLNHALAGWCDAGWHSSTLTLELFNFLRYRPIKLELGMPIGQVIFWEGERVPKEHLYSEKGQYNNQSGAQGSKGVR